MRFLRGVFRVLQANAAERGALRDVVCVFHLWLEARLEL